MSNTSLILYEGREEFDHLMLKEKIGDKAYFFHKMHEFLGNHGWKQTKLSGDFFGENADAVVDGDYSCIDNYLEDADEIFYSPQIFDRYLEMSAKSFFRYYFPDLEPSEENIRTVFLGIRSDFEDYLLEKKGISKVHGIYVKNGSMFTPFRKDHAAMIALENGIPIPKTLEAADVLSEYHDLSGWMFKSIEDDNGYPLHFDTRQQALDAINPEAYIAQRRIDQETFGKVRDHWLAVLSYGPWVVGGEFLAKMLSGRTYKIPLWARTTVGLPGTPPHFMQEFSYRWDVIARNNRIDEKDLPLLEKLLEVNGIDEMLSLPSEVQAYASKFGKFHWTSATSNYMFGCVYKGEPQWYSICDVTAGHNDDIIRNVFMPRLNIRDDSLEIVTNWAKICAYLTNEKYKNQHNNA